MSYVPECWQHIVKRKKLAESSHEPQIRDEAPWRVEQIPFRDANAFIREYEWLGHIGAAKYYFGLKIDALLAAVACYTTPSAPNAYRSLLGPKLSPHVYQLCRGASAHWAPDWAASRVISYSLRTLARSRGAKAVVAYADPAAGEIGTVYQASNAIYLGMTRSRGPGKYVIGGVEYHARAVQKLFGCAAHDYLVTIDPGYQRIQRTKKHWYVFVVCKGLARRELMDRLAPLSKPYPKRSQAQKAVA